jgi:hypothetical protein
MNVTLVSSSAAGPAARPSSRPASACAFEDHFILIRRVRLQLVLLIVTSLVMPGVARAALDPTSDVAAKAAFLFNFAKFTDWPSLGSDAPLMFCVVGDPRVAYALVETVRNQRIGSHAVEAKALGSDAPMRSCHVLFLSMSEARHSGAVLEALGTLPILTVSDAKDFARGQGVVEIFIENGRMRFSINTNAAQRSGLHLSARLLGLAKIVTDEPAHP